MDLLNLTLFGFILLMKVLENKYITLRELNIDVKSWLLFTKVKVK